ncbi:MAG: response regulator [Prevotellaceae bacterium]|jgi:signal transduction histidine kinase/ligand-binding sensor domain-containing protein/DNA-binding NarL/FixJ family response regulator|nr:response regulator [Prevotellaceae bacterium]
MKNITLSLLIILCLLPAVASSQEFTFNSINEQFGISVREITSVVRDDDGFIWAASRTGILRTAADDARVYTLPLVTTDVMQVKMACRGNRLIAITQNGQAFCYDRIQNRFELSFTLSSQLGTDGWVSNLLIDSTGTVWISTSAGLFVWAGGEVVQVLNGIAELSYITQMDADHLLVFLTSATFQIDTRSKQTSRLRGQLNYPISAVRYDDRTHRVWIGTYDAGLWQYDLQTQQFRKAPVSGFSKHIVRDIMLPDTASIWTGIDGDGIWILDRDAKHVRQVLREDLNNPSSLRGNGVYSLLMDDNHRVWTATNSGGLQYTMTAHPVVETLTHGINNPQSLYNNQVNSIVTDRNNNLWIATDDGISRRDARTHAWKHLYTGRQTVFLSLETDGDGHIYAGTYGEGLYVLDEATGNELHHYTEHDGDIFGTGGFVFATYTDSAGDVWMGGVKGKVYCFNPRTRHFRTYDTQPVYCFAEFEPGQILMGCAYGLLLMDKETGKLDVLVHNHTIHDIAVSGRTVWICTSGDGVIELDMSTAGQGGQKHYTTQQGISSNYTKSLLLVDSTLWIGTDEGLCRLNLKDNRIRTFANQPLLTNVSFSVNAACRQSDGRLAFGTNKGVVLFHVDKLDSVRSSGRIYFSNIIVAGRSIRDIPSYKLTAPIDSITTLHLDYPQNSFTLSVFPLGNISRSATFSWQLEGQDKGWNPYSTNRYINYTNLPAGRYRLSIRLYDGSILSHRQLMITVSPPFWKSAWFRLLITLLFIGLVTFVVRYYVQWLHRRYADEKIRFFARMAHDIRTSLMLIKAPVEELHKETGLSTWGAKCLSMASEQATRLTDTATQLLDFEKLDIGREQPLFANINLTDLFSRRISVHESYAAGRNIDIIATLTPDNYWTQVDARMMERVIDNLLSNAVKYSAAGSRIEVTFTGEADRWKLRVKDHGMGISKSAQRKLFREFYRSDNAVNAQVVGSGIGLLMTKKYITIHNGKIEVSSELNVGTTFDITVPLRLLPETKSLEVPEPDPQTDALLPAGDEAEAVSDMHILVVEDNRALREFMVHPLREHFHVSTADDGLDAWKKIEKLQPDLVVSDVIMPQMDGFELCRRIKSAYETSHIPVILLTALSDKTNQLKGLGLGADNYLVKPFDMTLLASRITSIIRNRRTVLQKAIEAQHDDSHAIVANRINDEFIRKAISCVRANIGNENFGKEDFASALALSQSLLYKKIKALTNLSVVEFIREIRLNYAMELLQSGKFNVTEVSEMCGFNTPAYFSRVFKEYFGKPPMEAM